MMYEVAKKLKNIKMEIRKLNKMDVGKKIQSKDRIMTELFGVQEEIQKKGYDKDSLSTKKSILVGLHNIVGKEEMFGGKGLDWCG